jgi:antitoxin (DNA-binding transcriptional repressor) of toxin-antitoxin stability system
LIERAIEGEEITLVKDGVPAVRLVPVPPAKLERPLGLDRGKIWIADDFDAPLPPDILAGFLGEEPPAETAKAKSGSKAKAKRRKKK